MAIRDTIRDLVCGSPHRVLGVQMILVDEGTNEILGRKYARIHETDISAGKLHVAHKAAETMIDAVHILGKAPA
jgi:hypothetical protein